MARNAAAGGGPTPTLFDIRRVDAHEVAALFALHERIVQALPDAQLYRHNHRAFFERHVAAEGLTLGVFVDGHLVAYALLRFPAGHEDNLGRDMGFEGDELARVAHLEECAVEARFRGRGLQFELTARRLDVAAALGYRHAAVTISPYNRPSLVNHFRHGLQVARMREKYGGYPRFVLHRPLAFGATSGQVPPGPAAPAAGVHREPARAVPLASLAVVGSYLDAGFRGWALRRDGDVDLLVMSPAPGATEPAPSVARSA
jgi:hypothetical protein